MVLFLGRTSDNNVEKSMPKTEAEIWTEALDAKAQAQEAAFNERPKCCGQKMSLETDGGEFANSWLEDSSVIRN